MVCYTCFFRLHNNGLLYCVPARNKNYLYTYPPGQEHGLPTCPKRVHTKNTKSIQYTNQEASKRRQPELRARDLAQEQPKSSQKQPGAAKSNQMQPQGAQDCPIQIHKKRQETHKTTKWRPTRAQEPPRETQDSPREAQRGSTRRPRLCQRPSKTTPKTPRRLKMRKTKSEKKHFHFFEKSAKFV